jgi:ESS family glutamate:Na+ symporter
MTIALNELWTAVAALTTILLGIRINAVVRPLSRYNIPPAVTGGLLVALALALLFAFTNVKVTFADTLRNALLLVFFASLGLTAKMRTIASGGRAVLGMCLLIAILAFSQSAIGVAIATAFGEPPGLGVFLGSVPFLGGHGTAVAWAETELGTALPHALEIGLVCATFGLVAGAIFSGIVGTKLTERALPVTAPAPSIETASTPWTEGPFVSERWIRVLLWLGISIALGLAARPYVMALLSMTIPAFLAVLLAAVVVTNVADILHARLDAAAVDLLGTLALRVFLAIAMMGLQVAAVGSQFLMIAVAVMCQVVLTVLLAVLAVAPMLRGRDGAVAAAGFIGFGLGAMPVGLAAMKRLTLTYGDAPRALLVLTLAGSLFTDTANALIVQTFLTWFGR